MGSIINLLDEIAEVFDRETFLTRFILKCMIEKFTQQANSPVIVNDQ